MENTKVSKKALTSLINDSMREAIGHLALPKPNKKVKKLLAKNSKKLADMFSNMLRKEAHKARKAEREVRYVDQVLTGKKAKKVKQSKLQPVEVV